MNLEAWKQRARQLSAQTYALYLAYRHPRTPWYAKVFAALIVGYVFSPIDSIPDLIPGVRLLDEMVVVPIGVLIAMKIIPHDVFKECTEKARELAEGERPVSRGAAVVVVAVWLLFVLRWHLLYAARLLKLSAEQCRQARRAYRRVEIAQEVQQTCNPEFPPI